MKRYMSYLLPIVALAMLISSNNKQNKSSNVETPVQNESKTVKDLKAACDGEATASAKYAAFAKAAAKEGLPQIETMFNATSKAEAIHLKNHQAALKDIGIADYKPAIKEFEVKSSAENLKEAIDGETYEFTKMYPAFLRDANGDYEDKAVKSFKYALGAEKVHAKLYAAALANIKQPKKLAKVFYVCPVCGTVYANTPSKVCELCGTPSDKFIKFAASK